MLLVEAELFHADGRTKEQADMIKVIIAFFFNVAKALKT
jgi:hypothetical protein